MKKTITIILSIAFTIISNAQIITTVAGNGTIGFGGDGGLATSALLSPLGITASKLGDLYIADQGNNRVRKVNKLTGIITTIAGNGIAGFSGDGGLAINASLNSPQAVALDNAGNIYIADANNYRIRKINTSGTISTVAGNGIAGFSGDGGLAIAAKMQGPVDIAIDNLGNLYIADGLNYRVRKVNSSGIISTIAGTGIMGFSGDGGSATQAKIYLPNCLAVDILGNVYIGQAEAGRVRKINTSGIITTFAGTTFGGGFSGDGGLATLAQLTVAGIAIDNSFNMLIADMDNLRIRKVNNIGIISTVAGTGTGTGLSTGDGGLATLAQLNSPRDVALDTLGNFYILSGFESRVREVIKCPTVINDTLNFNGCGAVYYKGQFYFSTTTFRDTTKFSYGCDSSYSLINIFIKPRTNLNLIACDSLIYKSKKYTDTTYVIDTLKYINGCDSVYVNAFIKKSSSSVTNTTINNSSLPFTWNGITFNSGGSQTAHFTNTVGCDSAATLNLTVTGGTGLWTLVGNAGFSAGRVDYSSIVFNGTTPYVAYRDSLNSNKLTVMKYDGANWITVGNAGFSAIGVNSVSLAFDGSTPYVAFNDDVARTNVMMYNGSSWVLLGVYGWGIANSISLAISGGIPYVAYDDVNNLSKAIVKKYNGSSWVTVGNANFSAGSAQDIKLVLNAGIPYVVYQDNSNSAKATVMKFNGTSWVNVGNAGFTAGAAAFHTLAFNGNTPYIAFNDPTNSSKTTVMMYNGGNWSVVGNAGFSAGKAQYISLAFSGTIPYVAYSDKGNNYKATTMKYDGTNWVNVGNAGFSAGFTNYVSLAFNGTIPYVAYQDGANSNKVTVMKYEAPLPVVLSNFIAKRLNKSVGLKWRTETEINSKRFEVQRSIDGVTFTTIGTVVAQGFASNYSFVDEKPFVGINYYRLKEVDNDGKFSLSQTKIVEFINDNKLGVTIFPNPAKTFISLQVNTLIGAGTIVVTDLYGKQVKLQSLSLGNNVIDVTNLSKGFYLVSVITNEGKQTQKLIVE